MVKNLVFKASLATAAAAVVVVSGSVGASADPIEDWKNAHDTDPHVPLSVQETNELRAREAEAAKYVAKRFKEAQQRGQVDARGLAFIHNNLSASHQSQINSYYCGPAALVISFMNRGISMTQSQAGSLLKTTTAGTAWSGVNAAVPNPTGYPMRDVYNYKLGYVRYYPLNLPSAPGPGPVQSFKNVLIGDIDAGFPVMGNVWEVTGGSHLPGHPNREIFHWVNVRGYSNSAALTNIADPASGATSLSWGSAVPKFSSIDTPTMVRMMGGRGYVF